MSESTPTSTGKLIQQAREAHRTHGGPINEDSPRDIPAPIEALQRRLEGFIQGDKPVAGAHLEGEEVVGPDGKTVDMRRAESGKPRFIRDAEDGGGREQAVPADGISWAFNGDTMSVDRNAGKAKGVRSERELSQQYEEEARQAFDDPRFTGLRRAVFFGTYVEGRTKTRNDRTADELNLAAALLHEAGMGGDYVRQSSLGEVVSGAMQIMRADYNGGGVDDRMIVWSGVGPVSRRADTSRAIVKRLENQRTGTYSHLDKITMEDMDALMISAFACGETGVALELASRAGEIVVDNDSVRSQRNVRLWSDRAREIVEGKKSEHKLDECLQEASLQLRSGQSGDPRELRAIADNAQALLQSGKLSGQHRTTAEHLLERVQELEERQNSLPNAVIARSFSTFGTMKNIDEGIFRKALDRYPESARVSSYASLAAIGEGSLSGLKDVPNAQPLKKYGLEKLRETLAADRNAWYDLQRTVPQEQLEALMGDEGIRALVTGLVEKGAARPALEQELGSRAEVVSGASVANRMAGELVRRLFPEYSLDEQVKYYTDMARGTPTANHRLWEMNFFANLSSSVANYNGDFDLTKGTPQEKQAKVQAFVREHRRNGMSHILALPNEQNGLAELLFFLKNPEYYRNDAREAVGNSQERRAGETVLGQRLSNGVAYLEAMCQEPALRKILETQFGFGDLISRDNLEKAGEVLADWFKYTASGNNPGDEEPLTRYEAMQAEGQPEEDGRVAKMLARSLEGSTAATLDELTGKADTVLGQEHALCQTAVEKAKGAIATAAVEETRMKSRKEGEAGQIQHELDGLAEENFFIASSPAARVGEEVSRRLKRSKDTRPIRSGTELAAERSSVTARLEAKQGEVHELEMQIAAKQQPAQAELDTAQGQMQKIEALEERPAR